MRQLFINQQVRLEVCGVSSMVLVREELESQNPTTRGFLGLGALLRCEPIYPSVQEAKG